MGKYAGIARTRAHCLIAVGTTCLLLGSALALALLTRKRPQTDERTFEEQEERDQFVADDGLVRNLVYISDPHVMDLLACPQGHRLSCFYRFTILGDVIKQPDHGYVTEEDCSAIFRALLADHADAPWCIREVRYSRVCTLPTL